eukprot:gene12166-12254_t
MASKKDFTDRFLKAIKPASPGKRVIVYDAQCPGLGIRVTEKSTDEDKGSFVLVARFPGSANPTPRRIGEYPAMTLAAARQIARAWREDIRKGIDPKVRQAAEKRENTRRQNDTFSANFEKFDSDHLSTLRTGKQVASAVKLHAFPDWEDRPISDIKRADINELIRKVKKDSPISANRLLAYLKKFFGWVVDQDILEASPAASIKRPSKETKRDRVLTDDEITAIWQACDESGAYGRCFQFMLATAQRRDEVGKMTWKELDGKEKVWRLSRERTKADRAHEVPLSATAMSIVEASPKLSDFIFSTGRSAVVKGKNESEIRPISGWSKAKSDIDALALEKLKAISAKRGDAAPEKLEDWHLHDLRRTAATHMAKLGVDRIVIGKILNHAESAVTAIYDRHKYDVEKRKALDLWGERYLQMTLKRRGPYKRKSESPIADSGDEPKIPKGNLSDRHPSREFLEFWWNGAKSRDPITLPYSTETDEKASFGSINASDLIKALEFLGEMFGDPAISNAALVLKSYKLGNGGIRERARKIVKKNHGTPEWLVMPFMQGWVRAGASVQMAAMKTAAQYGLASKTFDGAVKALTTTYADWLIDLGANAPEGTFPSGDTGRMLKVKFSQMPADADGIRLKSILGVDFSEDGTGYSPMTLKRAIDGQGFPPGVLITPNSRVWTEEEVKAWFADRPTSRKQPTNTKDKAQTERAA